VAERVRQAREVLGHLNRVVMQARAA